MKTVFNKWFRLVVMFLMTIPTWAQLPEEPSDEDPMPIDDWLPFLIIVAVAVACYFIKNYRKSIA